MCLYMCMFVDIYIGLGRLQSEHDDILPFSFFTLPFLFVDINYRKAKVYIALKFIFIIESLTYS